MTANLPKMMVTSREHFCVSGSILIVVHCLDATLFVQVLWLRVSVLFPPPAWSGFRRFVGREIPIWSVFPFRSGSVAPAPRPLRFFLIVVAGGDFVAFASRRLALVPRGPKREGVGGIDRSWPGGGWAADISHGVPSFQDHPHDLSMTSLLLQPLRCGLSVAILC